MAKDSLGLKAFLDRLHLQLKLGFGKIIMNLLFVWSGGYVCKYGTNCIPYNFHMDCFSDASKMGQFCIIRNSWQPF